MLKDLVLSKKVVVFLGCILVMLLADGGYLTLSPTSRSMIEEGLIFYLVGQSLIDTVKYGFREMKREPSGGSTTMTQTTSLSIPNPPLERLPERSEAILIPKEPTRAPTILDSDG